ncbi:hypothetical protein ACLM5H_08220 [Fredinandcohnia humi]
MEDIRLNVALLRRRVPNLTTAARSVGLRPATVSNLCTGKIPIGRSEVRTLVALADLAECSLDELLIRGEKIEMIETGIKTLDVFAPLAKGGTVGLVARPGMGQLVVLAEMFHRLSNNGFITILLLPEGNHPEVNDILDEIDITAQTIDEAYNEIAKIGTSKEIAFGADRSHVLTGEIQDLQDRLDSIGIDNVTTFLVDLQGEVVDDEVPYGPLETLWQFDADLAARHQFPAVNPIYSTSSLLEGAHLDQTHLSIQQRAKKLLRRYRELRSIVNIHGVERISEADSQTFKRGERLEAYLTQPFYVAEAYTGKQGEAVSLQDTLNDIRKILDGATDVADVKDVSYIGKLK